MEESAVDFLLYYLPNSIKGQFKEQIKQAKAMEEEQMEITWNNAIDAQLKDKWQSFDQFHNENFKSE